MFVSTNATFLEEDHMRDHKPRSKMVLNEAPEESTRVVDETGLHQELMKEPVLLVSLVLLNRWECLDAVGGLYHNLTVTWV